MFKKIRLSLLLLSPWVIQISPLVAGPEIIEIEKPLNEQDCIYYDNLDEFIDTAPADLQKKTIVIPQRLKNILVGFLLRYLAFIEYCSDSWQNLKGKFKKNNETSN